MLSALFSPNLTNISEEEIVELYTATWEYLAHLPTLQGWPDLAQLVQRSAANKPPHWRMAARACLAAGGTLAQAIPAVAAMSAHFLAIVLIDDLLDEDPKGQHHIVGVGAAANMASALQAVGYEAIARASLPAPVQASIYIRFNAMTQQTALGQYLDAQNPCDEASYWQVTRTKSSPYFATALAVGALVGSASEEVAAQLEEIGALYGEIVQINDDLNDALATPADPDWQRGRFSLPILYATLVPHAERARFLALRPQVGESWTLAEAQDILVRSGAISYGIEQLLVRGQRAEEMLAALSLPQRAPLDEMLRDLLEPVRHLLAQVAQ
jgi:geranylgeranyl pyrophosphate synthase